MKELAELKKYVYESEDLTKAIEFFFDLMEKDKPLRALGHLSIPEMQTNYELRQAISATLELASDILNHPLKIIGNMFNVIAQERFYHGICSISGYTVPMLVLYFADVKVGVAAVTNMFGKVEYFRFNVVSEQEYMNKH